MVVVAAAVLSPANFVMMGARRVTTGRAILTALLPGLLILREPTS